MVKMLESIARVGKLIGATALGLAGLSYVAPQQAKAAEVVTLQVSPMDANRVIGGQKTNAYVSLFTSDANSTTKLRNLNYNLALPTNKFTFTNGDANVAGNNFIFSGVSKGMYYNQVDTTIGDGTSGAGYLDNYNRWLVNDANDSVALKNSTATNKKLLENFKFTPLVGAIGGTARAMVANYTASNQTGGAITLTTDNVTFFVHSAPSINLETAVNSATIITGGSANFSANIKNNGDPNAANLYYLNSAGVQSGSVNLGALSNGSGNIRYDANSATSFSASSSNVGANVVRLNTSSDINPNTGVADCVSQSKDFTLNVLGHQAASLNQSAINFGNVLKGAKLTESVNLSNPSGFYAGAVVSSVGTTGGITSNDTNTGVTVDAGNLRNYILTVPTSSFGNVNGSFSVGVADANISGANLTPNNLTTTIAGNVGNAIASATNSRTSYGPSLTAHVSLGEVFGNGSGLESIVSSSTGSGSAPVLGTDAVLYGTANHDANVSMAWRARTQSETSIKEGGSPDLGILPALSNGLISDVVTLSDDIAGTITGSTLKMNYDGNSINGWSESRLVGDGLIYIAKWDDSVKKWVKEGNIQVVDALNDTVSTTIDASGSYAVVPEPATLSLLGLGGLALLPRGLRGRKAVASKNPLTGVNYLSSDGLDKGTQRVASRYTKN